MLMNGLVFKRLFSYISISLYFYTVDVRVVIDYVTPDLTLLYISLFLVYHKSIILIKSILINSISISAST